MIYYRKTLSSSGPKLTAVQDPEGYLLAVSKLGTISANCLAIEDSVVGVMAAQRAEIPVIQIKSFLNTFKKIE